MLLHKSVSNHFDSLNGAFISILDVVHCLFHNFVFLCQLRNRLDPYSVRPQLEEVMYYFLGYYSHATRHAPNMSPAAYCIELKIRPLNP